MFHAVAVGGTTRDRVSRAGFVRRLSAMPSHAVICEGRPWTGVSPLPCLVPAAPGTAVTANLLPYGHLVVIGHVDPHDLDTWNAQSIVIGGPGFNYMRKEVPPGAMSVTADEVPAYTVAAWDALFEHYPSGVRDLRPMAIASFYLTRSKAMIRDGADAFYRWANIVDGPAFEAEVARRLGKLAPAGIEGASLAGVIERYAASGLAPADVAVPVMNALSVAGGLQKEYDAYVLHVALRCRAHVGGTLDHAFHYSVVLACVRGDGTHDSYLKKLAPTEDVILVHDIGIDPNCDDFLAMCLADAIIAASCPPMPPPRGSSLASLEQPQGAQ